MYVHQIDVLHIHVQQESRKYLLILISWHFQFLYCGIYLALSKLKTSPMETVCIVQLMVEFRINWASVKVLLGNRTISVNLRKNYRITSCWRGFQPRFMHYLIQIGLETPPTRGKGH